MPKTKRASSGRATTDGLEILDALFFSTPRMKRLLEEEHKRVTLGDLIRQLREAQGITQAQLARKVGTSQSAIARIEDANYTGQKLGTIAKIAVALGHRVEVNLVEVNSR
jgi:DNA-binding XRE family transcriptional regulator